MKIPNTNKYGTRKKVVDGMTFDSTAEANYYAQLKLMQAGRIVSYFLRQVPIHLPGGVKYIVDFLVFYCDGTIEYIDVKGHKTETYKTKKKLVEGTYPITIREV